MYEKYVALRDKAGVTDYRVCKETGLSTATMTCWKQGIYTPKMDKIAKIAKYFQVPLEYFVVEEKA